ARLEGSPQVPETPAVLPPVRVGLRIPRRSVVRRGAADRAWRVPGGRALEAPAGRITPPPLRAGLRDTAVGMAPMGDEPGDWPLRTAAAPRPGGPDRAGPPGHPGSGFASRESQAGHPRMGGRRVRPGRRRADRPAPRSGGHPEGRGDLGAPD